MNYIKKITINKLFGELDIKWQLDPKVNILIGKNGSGKTTLLRLIKDYIRSNNSEILLHKNIDSIMIEFDGDKYISGVKPLQGSPVLSSPDKLFNYKIDSNIFPKKSEKHFSEAINICYINTFEMSLEDLERSDKYKKSSVNTELDLILANLINDWKSYLLTLKNKETGITVSFDEKIKQLSSKTIADINDLQELKTLLNEKNNKIDDINFYKNRFIEQINTLFYDSSDSRKRLDFDKNNAIIFRNYHDKSLSVFKLSSGEKQILIILLNVLLQENQPSIILMDEPEVSLHLAWQLDLIDMIQNLNENCQLIIVTHSAGLFNKGWRDKITKMENITTK